MDHKNHSHQEKLFSTSDIGSLDSTTQTLESKFKSSEEEFIKATYAGKSARFIGELCWMLDRKKSHIDFMTAGNLSLHTIIEFILAKYGRCLEMYISTWAIKEAAARSIRKSFDNGLIGSLHGIFDYRTESIDAKAFQLIKPVFHEYTLTKNHAKVILIEYEDIYITILTSANMSNNPRIEAGFISLSRTTFYFHKGWMMDSLKGKKVY